LLQNDTFNRFTLNLIHIRNDSRIFRNSFLERLFGTSNSDVEEHVAFGQDYRVFNTERQVGNGIKLFEVADFTLDPVVTVVTYRPKSLELALSEIGGLMVLFRLANMALGLLHEWCFVRHMRRRKQGFQKVYSFDTFDRVV